MELLTITEAAERLGVLPWEVVRLAEAGRVSQVVYIDGDSLPPRRPDQEQQQ